jgi:hypothetical protein
MGSPSERGPSSELVHCDPARWETREPLAGAISASIGLLLVVALVKVGLCAVRGARGRR